MDGFYKIFFTFHGLQIVKNRFFCICCVIKIFIHNVGSFWDVSCEIRKKESRSLETSKVDVFLFYYVNKIFPRNKFPHWDIFCGIRKNRDKNFFIFVSKPLLPPDSLQKSKKQFFFSYLLFLKKVNSYWLLRNLKDMIKKCIQNFFRNFITFQVLGNGKKLICFSYLLC